MCSCLATILLVVFNFILSLAGLLMVSVGIVAHVKPEYIFIILGKILEISQVPAAFDLGGIITSGAIFLMIVGAVVAAAGILGCFGACCGSRALLNIYICIVSIILCLALAFVVFAAIAPGKLKVTIQDAMHKTTSRFREDITQSSDGSLKLPNDPISLGWTYLQLWANCCGTYDYTDYSDWPHDVVINGRTRSAAVPISCCAKSKDFNPGTAESFDSSIFTNLNRCLDGSHFYINQKNCYDSVFDIILKWRFIAIVIGSGFSGAVVLLIVLACVLGCQVKTV